jgi:hypothetical protein
MANQAANIRIDGVLLIMTKETGRGGKLLGVMNTCQRHICQPYLFHDREDFR